LSVLEDRLSIPVSRWSTRVILIPFASITDVAEVKVRGQGFLYLTHRGGKTVLASTDFQIEGDYLTFCGLLIERTADVIEHRRRLELECENWGGKDRANPA
jgi:hypothetical protein